MERANIPLVDRGWHVVDLVDWPYKEPHLIEQDKHPSAHSKMLTITAGDRPMTVINVFTVAAAQQAHLVELLTRATALRLGCGSPCELSNGWSDRPRRSFMPQRGRPAERFVSMTDGLRRAGGGRSMSDALA